MKNECVIKIQKDRTTNNQQTANNKLKKGQFLHVGLMMDERKRVREEDAQETPSKEAFVSLIDDGVPLPNPQFLEPSNNFLKASLALFEMIHYFAPFPDLQMKDKRHLFHLDLLRKAVDIEERFIDHDLKVLEDRKIELAATNSSIQALFIQQVSRHHMTADKFETMMQTMAEMRNSASMTERQVLSDMRDFEEQQAMYLEAVKRLETFEFIPNLPPVPEITTFDTLVSSAFTELVQVFVNIKWMLRDYACKEGKEVFPHEIRFPCKLEDAFPVVKDYLLHVVNFARRPLKAIYEDLSERIEAERVVLESRRSELHTNRDALALHEDRLFQMEEFVAVSTAKSEEVAAEIQVLFVANHQAIVDADFRQLKPFEHQLWALGTKRHEVVLLIAGAKEVVEEFTVKVQSADKNYHEVFASIRMLEERKEAMRAKINANNDIWRKARSTIKEIFDYLIEEETKGLEFSAPALKE